MLPDPEGLGRLPVCDMQSLVKSLIMSNACNAVPHWLSMHSHQSRLVAMQIGRERKCHPGAGAISTKSSSVCVSGIGCWQEVDLMQFPATLHLTPQEALSQICPGCSRSSHYILLKYLSTFHCLKLGFFRICRERRCKVSLPNGNFKNH